VISWGRVYLLRLFYIPDTSYFPAKFINILTGTWLIMVEITVKTNVSLILSTLASPFRNGA
jgi:hypothetical protein